MQKEGKYWPYLIIGSIVVILMVSIYTVYLSFDYPIDNDESYFMPYQDVEKNYANIKLKEEEFLKYFAFRPVGKVVRLDVTKRPAILLGDDLEIQVKEKGNLKAKDLIVQAKLTRPHTKKQDKNVKFTYENDKFILNTKELDNGRWTLLIKFSINDIFKFYKLELCKNFCKK